MLAVSLAQDTVAQLLSWTKQRPLEVETGSSTVCTVQKVMQSMVRAAGPEKLGLCDWHLNDIGLI